MFLYLRFCLPCFWPHTLISQYHLQRSTHFLDISRQRRVYHFLFLEPEGEGIQIFCLSHKNYTKRLLDFFMLFSLNLTYIQFPPKFHLTFPKIMWAQQKRKLFFFKRKSRENFVCFLEAIKLNFQHCGSYCNALQTFQLCFIMAKRNFMTLFRYFFALHFQCEVCQSVGLSVGSLEFVGKFLWR